LKCNIINIEEDNNGDAVQISAAVASLPSTTTRRAGLEHLPPALI
jgi:hypothetical protein